LIHRIFQAIQSCDVSIYYFLSRFAGNSYLSRLARLEEENNLLKGGLLFAILWNYWFAASAGKRESNRRAIVSILLGAILAIAMARTLACVTPFRQRPMVDPAVVHAVYAVKFNYNLEQWNAFPSDTAAYFMALAFGIAVLSKTIGIPVVLYTAVWICLTRVYIGAHYASYILVGAAIGVLSVWAMLKSRWIQSAAVEPIVAAMERNTHGAYAIAFLISFEMATVFDGIRGVANAMVHGVGAGLHWRTLGTVSHSPLETWGGLLALLIFAVICSCIFTAISIRRRQALWTRRQHKLDWPRTHHS